MSFFSSLGKVLKSKTVWAGIGSGLLAGAQFIPTLAQYVPSGTPLGGGLAIVMAVLTIYGRIKAKQPLGPVIDDTIAQTVEAVHVIGAGVSALGTTTIANPFSTAGKVMQIAEVARIVKSAPPS